METSETAGSLQALSNELASTVERVGNSVVAINARQRIPSSGIIWREGVVLTAAHTIKREEEITVTLPDGHSVPAALAGRDSGTDLAVLKFEGSGWSAADLSDISTLKVGHLVLAVGRAGERGVSASLGVVSALSGPWRTWRGGEIDHFVRLDLSLYPGFSGGPLVDAGGRVVGLNTSGLARSAVIAVPASTINRVADQLLEKGHITRGYLGLGMYPVALPDSLRSSLNLPHSRGIIILSVEPGGPADKAGLLIGDVLLALDGASIGDTDDVQALLGPERVGKEVKASVVRGGGPLELSITIGARPRRSR